MLFLKIAVIFERLDMTVDDIRMVDKIFGRYEKLKNNDYFFGVD